MGRLDCRLGERPRQWSSEEACLNVEIEHVHRIRLVTDSVDKTYFGSKRPRKCGFIRQSRLPVIYNTCTLVSAA